MLAFLGIVILIAVLFFYDALSWGLVASKYWVWFALPIFPELPELSFGYAVGLMCLAGLFRYKNTEVIKKEFKDSSTTNVLMIIYPWLFLFFGWIIKSIFMV